MTDKYKLDIRAEKNIEDLGNYNGDCYDRIYNVYANLTDKKTGSRVADVTVMIMEYDYNEPETFIDEADEHSGDAETYASILIGSEEFYRYNEDYDIERLCNKNGKFEKCGVPVSGALHRLFIYPEYRRLHLGKNILKDIAEIIKIELGIRLKCVVVMVKPDECNNKTDMEQAMRDLLIKSGFRHVVDEFYIRDYMAEYFEG